MQTASLELLTHTRLAQSDDGQDPPLLLGGEHVSRLFDGIGLGEHMRTTHLVLRASRTTQFDVLSCRLLLTAVGAAGARIAAIPDIRHDLLEVSKSRSWSRGDAI
jgi:hypothetical protein